MTENLLHYFKDNQLDEVEERFQEGYNYHKELEDVCEYHRNMAKEYQRKLAFIAIERARRDG